MIADAIIELLERWRAPWMECMKAVPLSRVGARLVFKALLASAIIFVLELALGRAI